MVDKIESPKKEFAMPSKKKQIPVLNITKTKVAKRDRGKHYIEKLKRWALESLM